MSIKIIWAENGPQQAIPSAEVQWGSAGPWLYHYHPHLVISGVWIKNLAGVPVKNLNEDR